MALGQQQSRQHAQGRHQRRHDHNGGHLVTHDMLHIRHTQQGCIGQIPAVGMMAENPPVLPVPLEGLLLTTRGNRLQNHVPRHVKILLGHHHRAVMEDVGVFRRIDRVGKQLPIGLGRHHKNHRTFAGRRAATQGHQEGDNIRAIDADQRAADLLGRQDRQRTRRLDHRPQFFRRDAFISGDFQKILHRHGGIGGINMVLPVESQVNQLTEAVGHRIRGHLSLQVIGALGGLFVGKGLDRRGQPQLHCTVHHGRQVMLVLIRNAAQTVDLSVESLVQHIPTDVHKQIGEHTAQHDGQHQQVGHRKPHKRGGTDPFEEELHHLSPSCLSR